MAGSATLIPTSGGPPRGSKDGRMAIRHARIKCVAGRVAPYGWPLPCGWCHAPRHGIFMRCGGRYVGPRGGGVAAAMAFLPWRLACRLTWRSRYMIFLKIKLHGAPPWAF